jgi:hypothetical protein
MAASSGPNPAYQGRAADRFAREEISRIKTSLALAAAETLSR